MLTTVIATLALGHYAPPSKGWPLLNDISRRTFNFFVERSHPLTGFTKDRSRNFQEKDSDDHFVASVAAIGFALSAYAVGEHRGWMSHAEAVKVSRKTLKHMIEVAPKHRGWFYHWLNWETGKKEWDSELSSIDSAIFWCGMILNERALKDPEVTRMSNQILKAVDWKFMLTNDGTKPNKKTFSMGWRPNKGFLDAEWSGYWESMMIYLLALGADESIPSDVWKGFERKHEKGYGQEVLTGGPLFLHQMSHIFFDFKSKRDRLGYDYWVSSRNNTLAQIEFARQNPNKFKGYGGGIWGISACDIPDGYGAQGVLGPWTDNGTLAPPSAVASMMFTPKESMASAEAYVRHYPESYGKYSFVTGFNPTKSWVSKDMIGIDHGQMQLGIENARDGFPNKVFMTSPLVQRGMARAGFKFTKEGALEKRLLLIAPK